MWSPNVSLPDFFGAYGPWKTYLTANISSGRCTFVIVSCQIIYLPSVTVLQPYDDINEDFLYVYCLGKMRG